MYTELDLAQILAETRRPYLNRDATWDRRRNVRHGRSKPWLPKNIELFGETALLFQDRLPEFVINRIKQRLGANDVQIAVHVRGDVGPVLQRKGEDMEDWFRGVHEELDPLGLVDDAVREHQAADGNAAYELEFLPAFTPPARANKSDKEYDSLVDDGRRSHGLPVTLSAPDPRSLYTVEARNKLLHVCKVMDVPLVDIRNSWTAEGFRLAYRGDVATASGGVEREYIIAGGLAPSPTAAEFGRLVRVVRIADANYIYDCIYPNAIQSGGGVTFDLADGQKPTLLLLAKYPNPINRPPFFFAPARSTSDADPAFRHNPLALELLETAPYINQWRTIRMLRGMLDALKPVHVRPNRPGGESTSAAKNMPDLWRPGFLEYDGTMNEIPSSPVPDFDILDKELNELYNRFDTSIMGAMQSGAVGKSTPAWSLNIFNEEQAGLLTEPLNSRATAAREVLLSVAQVCRTKYAKDGPVYVRASRHNRKRPEVGRVDLDVGVTADDFNLQFRLEVSIEALTQSQRAADTEYWRRLRVEGTISQETYEEKIGVVDRVAEQARKDREAVMGSMREDALRVARHLAKQQLLQVYPPEVVELVMGGAQPVQMPPLQDVPPDDSGLPPNGEDVPTSPGIGMQLEQPQLSRNGVHA